MFVLDEEELNEALSNCDISKMEYNRAIDVSKEVIREVVTNKNFMINLVLQKIESLTI